MKIEQAIAAETDAERELLQRLGPLVGSLVKDIGVGAVMALLHQLAARGIQGKEQDNDREHLLVRCGVDVAHLQVGLMYDAVLRRVTEGEPPEPEFNGLVELDAWIPNAAGWLMLYVNESSEVKDFTDLDDVEQRVFMLIAAEALYGPLRDDALLCECYWSDRALEERM